MQQITNSWKEIDLRDQCIIDFSTKKSSGTAHDQHHTDTMVGQVALHAWESNAVVGCANHQRVLREPLCIQRIKYSTNALIKDPGAGFKSAHVEASLGSIGQRGRRQGIMRIS